MQQLLRRYRDLTVLILVLAAQLLLLAFQIRGQQEAPAVRLWTVSVVLPMAEAAESLREATIGALREYFYLLDVKEENRRLQDEVDRLKQDNQFLTSELATADRARTLAAFQHRSPSRTIAARLIGSGTELDSKTIFVDRGSGEGVARGMAVVTPDGIVGKVVAAYPSVSHIMLITDPSFAAGVISESGRVPGTLKGEGDALVTIDYVPNEADIRPGEWFYTSGADRIFPKGLPVGEVRVSESGPQFRAIRATPAGLQRGVEEVLIVLDAVHQSIPDGPPPDEPLQLLPPPDAPAPEEAAPEGAEISAAPEAGVATEADRLAEQYRQIGAAQGHIYGEGRAPDFNAAPRVPPPAEAAPGPAAPAAR